MLFCHRNPPKHFKWKGIGGFCPPGLAVCREEEQKKKEEADEKKRLKEEEEKRAAEELEELSQMVESFLKT